MTMMAFSGYPPSLPPGPDPFPYGRFNTSENNYTGPIIRNVYYDYHSLGSYLATLKAACVEVIGPGFGKWTYLVSECVIRNLANEQAKANLASYSYIMTLWPAFVSLFASLGPDASDAAYDNLLWGAILAVTSGAMAGFQSPPNVPHVLRTTNLAIARTLCEKGETALPHRRQYKVGRYSRTQECSYGFSAAAWLVLGLVMIGWICFVVLFLLGLKRSFYYSTSNTHFAMGSTWFFLAPVPALAEMAGRLYYNNIDLYEPTRTIRASSMVSKSIASSFVKRTATDRSCSLRSDSAPDVPLLNAQPDYHRITRRYGILIWWRIFCHQLAARRYRILVRPYPINLGLGVLHACIQSSRFTLLVLGLILQSTFMFFPPEFILTQTVILAGITILPRIMWPNYWTRDRRGADLVVFCDHALAVDIDDIQMSTA